MTAAITFSCKNDTGSHTYHLVLIKSRFRSQNLKVSCNRSNFDFKLNMRNVLIQNIYEWWVGGWKRAGIEMRLWKQANDEYELVLLNITVLRYLNFCGGLILRIGDFF